ncbi:hypothetical protein MBR_08919, partial [Metarhizium brunneum ARSEF 3297]
MGGGMSAVLALVKGLFEHGLIQVPTTKSGRFHRTQLINLSRHGIRAAYNPEDYSSLPSLSAAFQQLQHKGGESIITGPIRDIFLSHGAQDAYGIALLHKHFDIRPTDRLVDIQNVSSPWETGGDIEPVLKKYHGVIMPRSLRFSNGMLKPYEFDFVEEERSMNMDENFLEKLLQFLQHSELDQVLGLRVLDSRDPGASIEVTERNSNIMIPLGAIDEANVIPAMWDFGPEEDQRCHCSEYCYTDNKGKHSGQGNHGCG